MRPVRTVQGRVAFLDRANVDTDQIIPKQFLKRIERTGYGQYLFYDWRTGENGQPNPHFELNRPEYRGATILVTRANFGCGSSREHAVWAIADYGFQALISTSFANIFYNNCLKNGLLAIALGEAALQKLFFYANSGLELTVDLPSQTITSSEGWSLSFSIPPQEKKILLEGLDEITKTLQREADIAGYERERMVPGAHRSSQSV